MVFSLVAFQGHTDEEGEYLNQAAVPDEIATVQGNYLYVPADVPNLIGAYGACGGTVEGGAYLKSPSLRALAYYDLQPTQEAIKPSGSESVRIHPTMPIPLTPGEGLEAMILSNPGAAEYHTLVAFLADAAIAPVTGVIHPVKFSTAITETVGKWSNGAIIFSQSLPVGKYQIVGAVMWGTSGVAFRFVLKGYGHRPGFICHSSEGNRGADVQRYGQMGVWGEFDSNVPPSVDWLAMATSGSAQTGIMDLIKVA